MRLALLPLFRHPARSPEGELQDRGTYSYLLDLRSSYEGTDFRYAPAMTAYTYILANKNQRLYVGVTNDLERRVGEHKSHTFDGFTAKYNVEKLVWFQTHDDILGAIAAEKKIKNRDREWKRRLIEATNPQWRDLSEGWE